MAKAIIQQQVDYLEVFRKSLIGVPMTFVAQEVPDAFMICDGSLILFEDWPEFQQMYNEGRFNGMTLSAADPAQVGKFVLNGSSGVYLPDLEGLYEQASSAANAGAYLAAGLPNIKGSADGIVCKAGSEIGAIGLVSAIPANIGGNVSTFIHATMTINASSYSAIYSDSINTVQPPSVQYVRAMYLGKPNSAAA